MKHKDPTAEEFQKLSNDTFIWNAFDPASKVELCSTCMILPSKQAVLIDPVRLSDTAKKELLDVLTKSNAKLALILITNSNHARAASVWQKEFSIPVYAGESAVDELAKDGLKVDHRISDKDGLVPVLDDSISAIGLRGFFKGELAYLFPLNHSTVVVGDPIINLDPYGFCELPDKYSDEPKEKSASLKKLSDIKFDRMLFAHGNPLTKGAHTKFESLLH